MAMAIGDEPKFKLVTLIASITPFCILNDDDSPVITKLSISEAKLPYVSIFSVGLEVFFCVVRPNVKELTLVNVISLALTEL